MDIYDIIKKTMRISGEEGSFRYRVGYTPSCGNSKRARKYYVS